MQFQNLFHKGPQTDMMPRKFWKTGMNRSKKKRKKSIHLASYLSSFLSLTFVSKVRLLCQ